MKKRQTFNYFFLYKKVFSLILMLLFFTSLNAQDLDKTAPFSAIEWNVIDKDYPKIVIKNNSYILYAINDIDVCEIIKFCKIKYEKKAFRRFNEDLSQVFYDMQKPIKKTVKLTVSNLGNKNKKKNIEAEMTKSNRKEIVNKATEEFNKKLLEMNQSPKVISKEKALNDLAQLKNILEKNSSYLDQFKFDYTSELKRIANGLSDSVYVADLTKQLEKFIGSIGDRHSSASSSIPLFSNPKFLPFIVAPFNEKIVALKTISDKNKYSYYLDKYPYLKSINGIPLEEFYNNLWIDKYAPKESKLRYFAHELRNLSLLFYKLNKQIPDEFSFTFTDEKKDKTIIIKHLDKNLNKWKDVYEWNSESEYFKMLDSNIGYVRLSSMISKEKEPNFFNQVPSKMIEFKNTKALIIDIRNNGGGTRDLLDIFSSYFISPNAEPWVANVAKIRNDQYIDEDIESMSSKYLYNYNSDFFSDIERKVIKKFMKTFTTEWKYDESKFSAPFFMMLTPPKRDNTYYYDKPVYILVNEACFSAASVFTSVLKGYGNIIIVGVNTDGSSGRSKNFKLENSNIRIKLSTMISFQRNGKTLDTNGTEPDIYLQKDMKQVLGEKDTQLEELLNIIKEKSN